MLTAPSTLGLFEEELPEVVRRVKAAGALLYMDGANMNAFLGVLRPGDLGFDIVHINTHKTLATPTGEVDPVPVRWAFVPILLLFFPIPGLSAPEKRFLSQISRNRSDESALFMARPGFC